MIFWYANINSENYFDESFGPFWRVEVWRGGSGNNLVVLDVVQYT